MADDVFLVIVRFASSKTGQKQAAESKVELPREGKVHETITRSNSAPLNVHV
jgi:hypothetical protein